ncbi:hypothetical protein EZH22_23185 [Xanthobacter dioxanivorans]|uniref:Rhamnogalacturonase A/B/Epimerase-like pectate lyase domain-containing protein n=2 Tax=Xanthobacter dioxanivorans TaxID=2528964 RepID=A0A974PU29_9HYPH|nr:hypothetical protein EZH22_23185 [Xanthobacter dioxanivorans]
MRGAGLMGLPQLASAERAAADSSTNGEKLYLPELPGSVARTISQRLADRISVLDFGAVGDGRTDDTQAFQSAADAAAATGKTLFVPATGNGYRITDTIQIFCRHVLGDSNYLGSRGRGTLVRFEPSVVADMKPCFAIRDGMYASGVFENIAIHGRENYARERLSEVVRADLLPDYQAFSPGVCAIGVFGLSQPTFRNISTVGVKAGLYLDSTNGHISSYDCYWSGLFGVYCHRNSEDYFFMGGQIHGIFACVVFGTFDHANHNGGFTAAMYRVHMGFSPYAFYQVRDHLFLLRCIGLSGRFDYVRFERIGEAIFNFLPQSISGGLSIDSFGMSWSPIHREFPKPQPSGWITNLPPDILPYEEQQQYMMRFGVVQNNVHLSWLGDMSTIRRSPYAEKPRGIALFEYLACSDTSNLAVLRGDFEVKRSTRPDSWTRYRIGPAARKGDLMVDRDVAPAGNLLAAPEAIGNWSRAPDMAGAARLTSGALKDMWDSLTAEATGSQVGSQTAREPPLAFLEELGANPTVLKLEAGPGRVVFRLPFGDGGLETERRALYLGFWVFGGPIVSRVRLGNGHDFYETYSDGRQVWKKIVCVDQIPASKIEALTVQLQGGVCLLAGVMATLDGPAPYNARNVPRVRGGLALEKVETDLHAPPAGEAAPLPTRPAGYLTVEINGEQRRLPYY